MSNIMSITFLLKKFRTDTMGFAPLYVRITINKERAEFSLKCTVEKSKWIKSAGIARGTTDDVKALNNLINTVKGKLNAQYSELLALKKNVTAEDVKNAYFGIKQKGKLLVSVFEHHNKQMKGLVGKDFAPGTLERYSAALTHIKNFLKDKFKQKDIELKDINLQFITDLEYYLKDTKNLSHNSAIKYITNFKKIIRISLGNGWIEKDPFINYKIQLKEVQREYLTEAEIQKIINKTFTTSRIEQIRDVFIFCCYTGLAYADVKKLSKEHIIKGIDEVSWIRINRTKTDTRSSIPLLPIPLAIMEKYSTHPKCINQNRLFPVCTNQKINEYLKEIASLCGIGKTITFHIARHTFATTVTLTNNVPIESVSKMLGHKSIRTTQHYAKVVDRKISEDMQILKEKMEAIKSEKKFET